MPLECITVEHDTARGAGGLTGLPLARHLLAQAGQGPVVVMIHGYKYLPGDPRHCPHLSIMAADPCRDDPRIISWPRRLGLCRGKRDEGLGLSFGWRARGSIWQAHRRAHEAGTVLGALLTELHRLDPERPVQIVAHSLGARVALRALSLCPEHAVQRAVLLSAAEFCATTKAALQSPGGRSCQVLNVTSRENDLFDFLIERLIAAPCPGDRVLGHGALSLPNLATLQLDDGESLRRLRRAGYPLRPASRAVCHWSTYLRPGAFPLYRAFLDGRLSAPYLRALLPCDTAPRWSRLLTHGPRTLWAMPFRRTA